MSPGSTMLRVYETLKSRIRDGSFEQGMRLDPSRLKAELASSQTPVRDALHRLGGEGMVESRHNEGFRTRQLGENAIRDLYEWGNDLAHLVLRVASRRSGAPDRPGFSPTEYAATVDMVLMHLASLSPNHEHRRAIESLRDRGYLIWKAEEAVCGLSNEIDAIATAVLECHWAEAGRLLDGLHRLRSKTVPTVAAWLRDQHRSQL
jgi:DNA-binding transcriptional MocR family regulator